jgi:hypothetical protein
VVDEGGEFGEGVVGGALGVVFHGEAVAGEGVGGVGGEDFGEGGNLVHDLMVRFGGGYWQAWGLNTDLHGWHGFKNRQLLALEVVLRCSEGQKVDVEMARDLDLSDE